MKYQILPIRENGNGNLSSLFLQTALFGDSSGSKWLARHAVFRGIFRERHRAKIGPVRAGGPILAELLDQFVKLLNRDRFLATPEFSEEIRISVEFVAGIGLGHAAPLQESVDQDAEIISGDLGNCLAFEAGDHGVLVSFPSQRIRYGDFFQLRLALWINLYNLRVAPGQGAREGNCKMARSKKLKTSSGTKPKSALPLEVQLAIGRLFLMGSRPYQSGDDIAYANCRSIIMADAPTFEDRSPNYARDYRKGAQGD